MNLFNKLTRAQEYLIAGLGFERIIAPQQIESIIAGVEETYLVTLVGEDMYQDVKKYIESLNLDMYDVTTSPYYRTAVNMHYLQRRFDHIDSMNEVTHGEVYQLF